MCALSSGVGIAENNLPTNTGSGVLAGKLSEQVVIIRASDRRRDNVARFQVTCIFQIDHGIDFRRIGFGPGYHLARFASRAVDDHVLSRADLRGGAIYADAQVVVTQPQQGSFTGLSAICPHQGCTVSQVTDGQIVCPCHNSRFSLDGAVVDGPAQRPLDPRQVTVADGSITLA